MSHRSLFIPCGALALLAALALSACGPGDPAPGYGSIAVQAIWPGQPGYATASTGGGFHTLVAPAGIFSMRADVKNAGGGIIASGGPWSSTPGSAGSGAIANVPAGGPYTVTLYGYTSGNGSGPPSYQGLSATVTVTAGGTSNGGSVPMARAVKAVAAGGDSAFGGFAFSLALGSDGRVFAWGDNQHAQMANGTVDPGAPAAPQVIPKLVCLGGTPPPCAGDLLGIQSLRAGGTFALALRDPAINPNEVMMGWGNAGSGKLFTTGNITCGGFPNGCTNQPMGLDQPATTPLAIATGGNHALQVNSINDVAAWGNGISGQLGNNDTVNKSLPVQVCQTAGASPGLCATVLTNVIAVAGGGNHSLALKGDTTVWGWGNNAEGELADGTISGRNVAVQACQSFNVSCITPLTNVVAIAAGFAHSLALKSDGTVWVWGSNASGQLGQGGSGTPPPPPTSSVALQVCFVFNITCQTPLTGVVAIAAGANHNLALKSDGTVVAWGAGDFGQMGSGIANIANTLPLPVCGPGAPLGCGGNFLSGVASIAAGAHHNLAIKSDGTVLGWGRNDSAQLAVNPASSPICGATTACEKFPIPITIP